MIIDKKFNFSLEIGKRIKDLRILKGWSQEQLSFESQLHRTYIGSVERGERNITLVNLKKITDALKISPAEFFNPFEK
jgi:transcriptional regulator with XRE-family HTH domain